MSSFLSFYLIPRQIFLSLAEFRYRKTLLLTFKDVVFHVCIFYLLIPCRYTLECDNFDSFSRV